MVVVVSREIEAVTQVWNIA